MTDELVNKDLTCTTLFDERKTLAIDTLTSIHSPMSAVDIGQSLFAYDGRQLPSGEQLYK